MGNVKLLNAITKKAVEGILTINQDNHIECINPAALQLFGYDEQEVIGKHISILIPPSETGNQYSYLSQKGREIEGHKKDGSTFPFRLAVYELNYNQRTIYACFLHHLATGQDAEQKLKACDTTLEHLVDERGRSLKNLINNLNSAKGEAGISPESERELNLMQRKFVSMAAHEFRTPLSAVQLSAVLIEKYTLNFDRLRILKHVNRIKNAVANLTVILNDFLTLEKLEAGKVTPFFKIFDIIELCEEIIEEMRLITGENQQISYRHTGLESMVYLDADLLRNCIINLITNAIKYSGEHTSVQLKTEINTDEYLITVRDNGIGIAEEDQKTLFQPFFRAHPSGTISGTGLGLNIVIRYAELMGGTLECKSKLNEGAKFILSFKKQ